MEAKAVPNHTHTCIGGHSPAEDHFCGVCSRYWWQAPKQRVAKPRKRV